MQNRYVFHYVQAKNAWKYNFILQYLFMWVFLKKPYLFALDLEWVKTKEMKHKTWKRKSGLSNIQNFEILLLPSRSLSRFWIRAHFEFHISIEFFTLSTLWISYLLQPWRVCRFVPSTDSSINISTIGSIAFIHLQFNQN